MGRAFRRFSAFEKRTRRLFVRRAVQQLVLPPRQSVRTNGAASGAGEGIFERVLQIMPRWFIPPRTARVFRAGRIRAIDMQRWLIFRSIRPRERRSDDRWNLSSALNDGKGSHRLIIFSFIHIPQSYSFTLLLLTLNRSNGVQHPSDLHPVATVPLCGRRAPPPPSVAATGVGECEWRSLERRQGLKPNNTLVYAFRNRIL